MELMAASNQWASRPADQRFTSLLALQHYTRAVRATSAAKVIPSRQIEARPVADDLKALAIYGPQGVPTHPTHWAFGQLASLAGAPAGYLRKLPSPLAADCINVGLLSRDVSEIGMLLQRPGPEAPIALNAATGPNYGRVWNHVITDSLVEHFGDGITGEFRVPGEFGKRVEVTQANTTLYASDRDMFVFLADEERRIEVPNRRNGQPGSMARGFFVWNSDVGAGTLGVAMFLFDYVCMNRIVWGAQDVREIRVRHTSGAPHRWLEQVKPAILAYARASEEPVRASIEAARQTRIDDVKAYLSRRFNNTQAQAIAIAHVADEGRPIETVWDAVTGITAYARDIVYQDERIEYERIAGQLLAKAA